jgi:hypothetical protein
LAANTMVTMKLKAAAKDHQLTLMACAART